MLDFHVTYIGQRLVDWMGCTLSTKFRLYRALWL